MSFKILGHVIHNVSLPPTQKLVLIVLADFYNEEFGKAWPSQDTLCAVTGLSLRSINRAISELKKKGHIVVWRECSAGQYAHNAYGINHAPQGHMVEKVGAKNDQTIRQKELKPCATVAYYPLRTYKEPLNKKFGKKEKMLSEKQKKFAENLARKLQEKHRNEYYPLEPLYKDCKEFLLTNQTDDDWKKLGNGLPNPLNL